jgi:hypothetical protein
VLSELIQIINSARLDVAKFIREALKRRPFAGGFSLTAGQVPPM